MITRIGIQFLGWLLLALLAIGETKAQQVNMYWASGSGLTTWNPVSTANPLPVSASASITGFPGTTQTTGTPISVTTGGVTGTLPAGAVVVASNIGTTNAAYCKLGSSATTSDQYIAPGSWFGFTVGSNTQLTCITSTSTTTVNMVGGSGLPTGAGGGGSGSSLSATATAAAPSYSEGTSNPISMDLSGNTRVIATGLAQGSTTSGQTGSLIMGAVTTAAPSYTNAQTSPFSLDTAGNTRVALAAETTKVIGTTRMQGNVGGVLDAVIGAAAPANSMATAALSSGATGGLLARAILCDNHVFKHITSATDTVAVQGVASQTIYICAWRSRAAGVATWYLENTASTNNNCSSTLTQITGVATEAANTGETWGGAFWSGLKNTSGNGLCINSTGTGGVDIDIWYTQF